MKSRSIICCAHVLLLCPLVHGRDMRRIPQKLTGHADRFHVEQKPHNLDTPKKSPEVLSLIIENTTLSSKSVNSSDNTSALRDASTFGSARSRPTRQYGSSLAVFITLIVTGGILVFALWLEGKFRHRKNSADNALSRTDTHIQLQSAQGGEVFGEWRRTSAQVRQFQDELNTYRLDSPHHQVVLDEIAEADHAPSSADSDEFDVPPPEPVAQGTSTNSTSDNSTNATTTSGLRNWRPELYMWFQARLGTGGKLVLILSLILISSLVRICEALYWETTDSKRGAIKTPATKKELEPMVFVCITNLVSCVCSISVSLVFEGIGAVGQICNWHALWRWQAISALFVISQFFHVYALRQNIHSIVANVFGFLYLPVLTLLSSIAFKRKYGQLEWISVFMLTLAVMAFILVRERCKKGVRSEDKDKPCSQTLLSVNVVADYRIIYVIVAVFLSCVGSILAERIFKGRSPGLRRISERRMRSRGISNKDCRDRFYIMKAHQDICATVISFILSFIRYFYKSAHGRYPAEIDLWSAFGSGWGGFTFIWLVVKVIDMALCAFTTKTFSSVVKALAQAVAVPTALMVEDLMFWLHAIKFRVQVSFMLVSIIILSAMVFQTGRIILDDFKSSVGYDQDQITMLPVSAAVSLMRSCIKNIFERIGDYSLLVFYIFMDMARTEMQTIAIGKSMITPQSMAIMVTMSSAILYNVFLFTRPRENWTGMDELRNAWNITKIVKFLSCGFLFAATSALMSMSFGLGMSGTMAVIIGKIYLPVAALGSFFFTGRFYLWLEWFAIFILTLAAMCFGKLELMGSRGGGYTVPLTAVLCVGLSATCSALNSLNMEMVMKGENELFATRKVQIDVGTVLWSWTFLPVMGLIGNHFGFAQGAFWKFRPTTRYCATLGHCTDAGAFRQWNGSAIEIPECHCDWGIFVCWDDYKVFAMLGVELLYATVVSLFVKRFSSVDRAVADAASLLLVYFVADPLINNTTISDAARNMVAFIIPLSTQLFTQASNELKKVHEARKAMIDAVCNQATDDEMVAKLTSDARRTSYSRNSILSKRTSLSHRKSLLSVARNKSNETPEELEMIRISSETNSLPLAPSRRSMF